MAVLHSRVTMYLRKYGQEECVITDIVTDPPEIG